MIKSGEIVQIKDSAYDGLTGLTIYGNTRQNLWQNPSGTVGGITVTSNSDGSMTLSGSHDSTVVIEVNTHILKPNTAYVLYGDKNPPTGTYFCVGNPVGAAYKTGFGAFTTGSDVDGCVFAFVMQGAIAGGVEMSGTYRVMLREATAEEVQALAQMPVTIPEGGTEDIPQDHPMLLASGDDDFDWCPPGLNSVGDGGSVEVVTAGKNLTENKFYISQYSYGRPNGMRDPASRTEVELPFTSTEPYQGVCKYFWAKAGEVYKVTLVNGPNIDDSRIFIQQFFPNQVTVTGTESGYTGSYAKTANSGDSVVFPNDGLVVLLSAAYGSKEYGFTWPVDFDIQVEPVRIVSVYEPPRTKRTAIDLQGHKLCSLPDGTRDELHVDGDGRVTLIKRIGSSVFDASSSPNRTGTYGGVDCAVYDEWPGDKPWNNPNGQSSVGKLLCDKYNTSAGYGEYHEVDSVSLSANGGGCIHTVVAGTSTSVIERNVVYLLETPQTINLGTVDLPKLQKLDVNTVYVADDTPATIDVEYNRYRSGCDGFKVDGKHNYWEMRACLASRDTGVPEKKLSTVTVPYMSGFYDLSKLYGAIAFESREVAYTMEFVEDTTEELQARKSAILQWLSMVHDADIFDDDFPGYHFHGSYSDASWEEDDSGLQGSLEVTFLCHPFLVADGETSVSLSAGEKTVTVEGQPVNAYAVCASGSATVKFRGVQQSVGTTPVRLSAQLQSGDNAVTVTGSAVTLTWNEERV